MCLSLLYELAISKDFKQAIRRINEEEIEKLWSILTEICPEKCKHSTQKTQKLCRSPHYFQSIIVAIAIIGIQTAFINEFCDNGEGNESN